MSWIVQNISGKLQSAPKSLVGQGISEQTNNWQISQIDIVDDNVIALYQNHTDTWSIIGQNVVDYPIVSYVANSSVVGFTLTAANVATAGIENIVNLTGAISAGTNVTLPTVASVIAFVGSANINNNETFKLRVVNSGGTGSGVWTVTTNTGWTLNGTQTVAVGGWRDYVVTITSVASATASLQAVGTGTIS